MVYESNIRRLRFAVEDPTTAPTDESEAPDGLLPVSMGLGGGWGGAGAAMERFVRRRRPEPKMQIGS